MHEKDTKKVCDKDCTTCRHEDCEYDESPCVDCIRGAGDDEMWEAKAKKPEQPQIKDSGSRRVFESGAVRDICEGKGRCDLLPLDVIGSVMNDSIIVGIADFVFTHDTFYLIGVVRDFTEKAWKKDADMVLDLAKHFEEGAKKYDERSWEKGLPVHCYIDSAVRHYLKWRRGDKDEPHDRAFVWNLVCCIWTMKHRPDLDDLPKKEEHHEPVSG